MRVHCFLLIAGAAALHGQDLKWARENIDAHATMRHFEPPARSSGTRWQVGRIEGCSIELKQISHREAPDSVEDKTVTWAFDMGSLKSRYVMADTSTGLPHIKIFAEGDVFHLKTETATWSTSGNARNLWMYFDSPDVDNKVLVRRLEGELRRAIEHCRK